MTPLWIACVALALTPRCAGARARLNLTASVTTGAVPSTSSRSLRLSVRKAAHRMAKRVTRAPLRDLMSRFAGWFGRDTGDACSTCKRRRRLEERSTPRSWNDIVERLRGYETKLSPSLLSIRMSAATVARDFGGAGAARAMASARAGMDVDDEDAAVPSAYIKEALARLDETVVAVLRRFGRHKLLSASAPDGLRAAVAVDGPDSQLPLASQCLVLRELVSVGAVDPSSLAAWLGKDGMGLAEVRGTYVMLWAEQWINGYFRSHPELALSPESQPRPSFFVSGAWEFQRLCGSLLADAIRDFFTKPIKFTRVEQNASYNLIQTFASVLTTDDRVALRLERVRTPDSSSSLSDAVLRFAFLTLFVTTEASNKVSTWTRAGAGTACEKDCGFLGGLCMSMYDIVSSAPFT